MVNTTKDTSSSELGDTESLLEEFASGDSSIPTEAEHLAQLLETKEGSALDQDSETE